MSSFILLFFMRSVVKVNRENLVWNVNKMSLFKLQSDRANSFQNNSE